MKKLILPVFLMLIAFACTNPDINKPGKKNNETDIKLLKPIVLPVSGSTISLDDEIDMFHIESDALIYYTLDNSIPDEKSYLFTKEFTLRQRGIDQNSRSIIVNAAAFKKGVKSEITSVSYTIKNDVNTQLSLLSEISLSAGNLLPVFSPSQFEYTVTVANNIEEIEVSASADNKNCIVKFNDDDGSLGEYSGAVKLNVGRNTLKVKTVNDDSGITYTITIIRQSLIPSGNALLKSLSLSKGTLNPSFKSDVFEYSTAVDGNTSSISINAEAEDEPAVITVDNNSISSPFQLAFGENTIIIKVKAEDETVKTYKLHIVREQPVISKNAELSSLSVRGITLNKPFEKETLNYTASVGNDVFNAFIDIKTEDDNAKITVSPSNPVQLKAGDNEVKIEITAEDGETKKTYTINIFRESKVVEGIIVYAYDYTHIWAWDLNGVKGDLFSPWPGKELTDYSISEGDKWKGYHFKNGESVNVIFTNAGAGKTSDLSFTSGEWWYKDGRKTDYNPTDSIPPSCELLSPDNNEEITGIYVIKTESSDNIGISKVEFYVDGKKIGETKSYPYNFSWNSAALKNGGYVLYAAAFDMSGNKTESSKVTVRTNNLNLPPVADAGRDVRVSAGTVVTFNGSRSYDLNGEIISYTWSCSEWSGNKTGVSVQAPFNKTGTYTVTLTVVDNESAVSSDSLTVTVVDEVVTGREDFREETVYFLMTARFYDGDPSNNRWTRTDSTNGNFENNDPSWRGDFKGLIEKLDYIKALGFTAVWITPPVLNRSDSDYHGYHAWDMSKIDPRLESAGAAYQDLINEIHSRDMKIIQDIVLNHSSRYGEKNLGGRILWGDHEDPDWGSKKHGGKADFYDEYNPDFEYDGLKIEPWSGKNFYLGDLYQKEKPTPEQLPWLYSGDDSYIEPYKPFPWLLGNIKPNLDAWGKPTQWVSSEGWKIYNFQWSEGAYSLLNPEIYHIVNLANWEDYTCQLGTIHPDCVDLNTESKIVQDYLIDTYNSYIEMGVDAFRIDTVKHMSRVMFNRHFLPAFHEKARQVRGRDDFYMVGEVCVRTHDVWNKGNAPLSQPFYTWKERTEYSKEDWKAAYEGYEYENKRGPSDQPTSSNHLLDGNNYRTPDYSKFSGMNVIDFRMHWNFSTAGNAFNVRSGDQYTNDATWNMTYVESHDYSPHEIANDHYARSRDEGTMAENWTLMWTWRGIPTIYYGNEILFKAGAQIDGDPYKLSLENSGRAYFGNHIEGSVNVTDFGKWTDASGEMKNTLSHPLARHLQRLNKIRHRIPALQKGQYSTEGITGDMAFKRRFTDANTDSFVLVTISGGAVFNNIPNGKYVDAVTGVEIDVKNGSLKAEVSGKGNARIFVLDTNKTPAPGKIGSDTDWLK